MPPGCATRFKNFCPASHLEFLQGLETQAIHSDYMFVRAGLRPGVPPGQRSDDDRLWISGEFLNGKHAFEKIVVHGHSSASDAPVLTPYRTGVDTGALTAVGLGEPAVEAIRAPALDEEAARLPEKDAQSDKVRVDG